MNQAAVDAVRAGRILFYWQLIHTGRFDPQVSLDRLAEQFPPGGVSAEQYVSLLYPCQIAATWARSLGTDDAMAEAVGFGLFDQDDLDRLRPGLDAWFADGCEVAGVKIGDHQQ